MGRGRDSGRTGEHPSAAPLRAPGIPGARRRPREAGLQQARRHDRPLAPAPAAVAENPAASRARRMTRLAVRWTVGDVSDEGFTALQLSIWGAWKAFGWKDKDLDGRPRRAFTVC